MEKIWKDIVGYEGHYQACEEGEIRSLDKMVRRSGVGVEYLKRGRILKPWINHYGYPSVMLHKEGVGVTITLHRVIAITFKLNPLNLKQVNHIDLNKLNCHISNLEWCDQIDNYKHAYRAGVYFRPSKSEYPLVRKNGTGDKWYFEVLRNGKRLCIRGKFKTPKEAHEAGTTILKNHFDY